MDPIKLTLILGALVAVMYWLSSLAKKRLGLGAGKVDASALRVVGKRALEPRKSLYVVEVGNRYILVGTSENGVSLVDRISAEEYALLSTPPVAEVTPLADTTDDADITEISDHARSQQFATVGESFSHLLSKVRNKAS